MDVGSISRLAWAKKTECYLFIIFCTFVLLNAYDRNLISKLSFYQHEIFNLKTISYLKKPPHIRYDSTINVFSYDAVWAENRNHNLLDALRVSLKSAPTFHLYLSPKNTTLSIRQTEKINCQVAMQIIVKFYWLHSLDTLIFLFNLNLML